MTSPLRNHPRIFPWWNPPNPVPAQEKGALVAPGPRFQPFTAHSFVRQRQPDPGAPAYAYELLGLVEFAPIGPGTVNRSQLDPLANAGTIFAGNALVTQGLGGIVQGQFIWAPLIVDPSLQSEDLYAPGGGAGL